MGLLHARLRRYHCNHLSHNHPANRTVLARAFHSKHDFGAINPTLTFVHANKRSPANGLTPLANDQASSHRPKAAIQTKFEIIFDHLVLSAYLLL
ncbi:MAG: hypothetical protein JKX83_06345 [Pseudomonadales bacterium]|nr:hypothetical protein [Pseudomonadales bacterium]